MEKPKVVDLFCGSGGMSIGFNKASFSVILGIDHNQFACETYKKNNPNTRVLWSDIQNISEEKINGFNNIDIIIGGFPCKPFSSSNRTIRKSHPDNGLYKELIRWIKLLSPRAFVIENVPPIKNAIDTKTNKNIFMTIINQTKQLGYNVTYKLINMIVYGLPQKRERIFLVGTKTKMFSFPLPKYIDNYVTVKDAISDLPEKVRLNSNTIHLPYNYTSKPKTKYQQKLRLNSKKLWNHFSTKNRPETKERFKYIPQGGNWRDIPLKLLPGNNLNRHNNLYHRLKYNSFSPTITHVRKTLLIHPVYNRLLSAREAARLQGFEDNYYFYGNKDDIYQQIADAVPPIFSEILAKHLFNYL